MESDQQSGEVEREHWSGIDVFAVSMLWVLPLFSAPAVLLAMGNTFAGVIVFLSSASLISFYESSLEEKYKEEVNRRVG